MALKNKKKYFGPPRKSWNDAPGRSAYLYEIHIDIGRIFKWMCKGRLHSIPNIVTDFHRHLQRRQNPHSHRRHLHSHRDNSVVAIAIVVVVITLSEFEGHHCRRHRIVSVVINYHLQNNNEWRAMLDTSSPRCCWTILIYVLLDLYTLGGAEKDL